MLKSNLYPGSLTPESESSGVSHSCAGAKSLTWAAQMLYCVNMASYKAISPLCPAAAQARASKTGIACNTWTDKVWLEVREGGLRTPRTDRGKQHSPFLLAGSAPSAGPAAHSGTEESHGASAACQRLQPHWSPASSLGLDSEALIPDDWESKKHHESMNHLFPLITRDSGRLDPKWWFIIEIIGLFLDKWPRLMKHKISYMLPPRWWQAESKKFLVRESDVQPGLIPIGLLYVVCSIKGLIIPGNNIQKLWSKELQAKFSRWLLRSHVRVMRVLLGHVLIPAGCLCLDQDRCLTLFYRINWGHFVPFPRQMQMKESIIQGTNSGAGEAPALHEIQPRLNSWALNRSPSS